VSRLVRGTDLSPQAREQVLSRFVYRWTADNPEREAAWRNLSQPKLPFRNVSDEDWLASHAFHVRDDGLLDERYGHAESAALLPPEDVL
jgi:hypothetical protein